MVVSYGIMVLCNFYVFIGMIFVVNLKVGCMNFVIGGGVINGVSSGLFVVDLCGI